MIGQRLTLSRLPSSPEMKIAVATKVPDTPYASRCTCETELQDGPLHKQSSIGAWGSLMAAEEEVWTSGVAVVTW